MDTKTVKQNVVTKTLIRSATVTDITQIVKVAESAFEHEYKQKRGISKQYFESKINSFDGLYVAQSDNRIFGFALYSPIVLVETAELLQIGVMKEEQGKGIGTSLISQSMNMFIEKSKRAGLNLYAIYLTTALDDPVAQRLYRKVDFEVMGLIKDTFVGKGCDVLVMTKILEKNRVYTPDTLWPKLRGSTG